MRSRLLALGLAATVVSGCAGAMGGAGYLPPAESGLTPGSAEAQTRDRPNAPDALVMRASVLLEHGQIAGADRLVRRALIRRSDHLGGLIVDARIGAARDDLDRAWTRFGEALRAHPSAELRGIIAPELVPVATALSRRLREADRPMEALGLMESLAQIYPASSGGLAPSLSAALGQELLALAPVLIHGGLIDPAEAALSMAEARGVPTDRGESPFVRVQILAARGGDTTQQLERWAEANPEERWLRVARLLEGMGDRPAALRSYGAATRASPDSVAAWRGLGRICVQTQDVACAQESFGRAAAATSEPSTQVEILLSGARTIRDTQGSAASLPLFEAACALVPSRYAVVEEAVRALSENMRHQAVERVLAAYVTTSHQPDLALDRCLELLREPRWRSSSSRVVERLAASPRPPRSLPLAEARNLPPHAVHDPERARHIGRFISQAPDELEAQLRASRLWLGLGRYGTARRHARRAQVLHPDHGDALVLEARSWEGQGEGAKAAVPIDRLGDMARTDLQAAISLARYELDERRADRALAVLGPWLLPRPSDPGRLPREFHRVRYRAALSSKPQSIRGAEASLRAWLAQASEPQRGEALEEVLLRTQGIVALRGLRIETLQTMTTRVPGDTAVRTALARELLAGGRAREAVRAWRQLVETGSDPDVAALAAGRALETAGYHEEALRFLSAVAPHRIEQDRTHRRMATLYTRRGQFERADVHHRLLMRRKTARRNLQGLRTLSDEMLRRRLPERAREAVDLRLAQRPKDRNALMDRVRVEILAVKGGARPVATLDQAVAALVEATPDGTRKHAWQRLAAAYEAEGMLERAALAYEAALRLHRPGAQIGAFKRLAQIYRRLGQPVRLLDSAAWVSGHGGQGISSLASVVKELDLSGLHEEAGQLLGDLTGDRTGDARLMELAFVSAVHRGALEAADRWSTRWLSALGHRAESWVKVAAVWSASGDGARALDLLERGAKGHPNDSGVSLALARARWTSGDLEGADVAFLSAVSHAADPKPMIKRIAAWMREARMNDWWVTLLARMSAALEPRHEPTEERIRALLATGDEAGAQAVISRHLGTDGRGHSEIAGLAQREGWPTLALRHHERALERAQTGDRGLPLDRYVDLLVDDGQADRVEPKLADAVARSRKKTVAMLAAARALIGLGRRASALAWLERAATHETQAEILLLRGRIFLEMGDHDLASDAFERFVTSKNGASKSRRRAGSPRNAASVVRTLEQVTKLYELRGAWAEGAATLARLREGQPARGDLAALEARLRIREGRIEDGLSLVRDLHFDADSPPSSSVWIGLAEALDDRGLRAEASDLLARVLDLKYQPDVARAHLRGLIERHQGVAAWRAARTLLGQGSIVQAETVVELAFEGGMPNLAAQVRGWFGDRGPAALLRKIDALSMVRSGAERSEAPGTAVAPLQPQDRLAVTRERARVAVQRADFSTAARTALAALLMDPGDRPTQRLALRMSAQVSDDIAGDAVLEVLSRALGSRLEGLARAIEHLRASGQDARAFVLQERLASLVPGLPGPTIDAVQRALDVGRDAAAWEWTETAIRHWGGEVDVRLELAETWQGYGLWERAGAIATFKGPLAGKRAWRAAKIGARDAHHAGALPRSLALLLGGISTSGDRNAARAEALDLADRWGVPQDWDDALVAGTEAHEKRSPRLQLARLRSLWRCGADEEARTILDGMLAAGVFTPSRLADAMAMAARAGRGEIIERLLPEMTAHLGVPEAHRIAGLSVVLALDKDGAGSGSPLSASDRVDLARRARHWLMRTVGTSHRPSAGLVSALGRTHEAVGDGDAALALYESAALDLPWDPSARNNWAYALAEAGRDLEMALGLVRGARRDHGAPMASFLDTEAWILHKLGRHPEASTAMDQALLHAIDAQHMADEGRVEMMYHQGRILEAVGDEARPRIVFRTCAKRGPITPWGKRCADALSTH